MILTIYVYTYECLSVCVYRYSTLKAISVHFLREVEVEEVEEDRSRRNKWKTTSNG